MFSIFSTGTQVTKCQKTEQDNKSDIDKRQI